MKPRRWFRFSLKAIFVVMFVAALGMVQWRRAESLRRKSAEHSRKALTYGRYLPYAASLINPRVTEPWRLNYWLSMKHYHEHLAQKSERTIWQPWVANEEDPPMPVDPSPPY